MKEKKYKIIAAALFFIWLALMVKSASFFSPKGAAPSGGGEELTEAPGGSQAKENNPYSYLIERLKSPFPESRYDTLIKGRNIFVKPVPPPIVITPENFTLLSVEAVTLPFIYNGYIQTPDGTIIAQINLSGKTYFVKKGGRFKDYRVTEIEKRMVKIEGKEGSMILDLKKPVKGKEFVAKFSNSLDNKVFEVRRGEEAYGYKVLDIKANSVILYGREKEWVVNKGR